MSCRYDWVLAQGIELKPGSKSKRKIYRYGILENLAFNLKPKGVYDFYHGRQTIEQFFKESTGPFQAGKMPSQKFRANEAYLQLVTIAENCCLWFKKLLPFTWYSDSMETLRDKLIHHGASIKFVGNICSLRLNATFRYQREGKDILENLRREVKIQQISYHKVLRKLSK